MPRSLDDLIAQADDLADEFENFEPQGADSDEPPLMAIRRAAYRRALIERQLLDQVRKARATGASWAQIGEELGTSGEAARQRYADLVSA